MARMCTRDDMGGEKFSKANKQTRFVSHKKKEQKKRACTRYADAGPEAEQK
jgi:hypothetical protein